MMLEGAKISSGISRRTFLVASSAAIGIGWAKTNSIQVGCQANGFPLKPGDFQVAATREIHCVLLPKHPLTDHGLEMFSGDWRNVPPSRVFAATHP